MPHHASPWNTILFPLSRSPTRVRVGERVSPVYLCVFARVCAHAFYPLRACNGAYVYINAVHLFPWAETMDLLTPALNDTIASRATQHPCYHRNHLVDTYPGHSGKPLLIFHRTTWQLHREGSYEIGIPIELGSNFYGVFL